MTTTAPKPAKTSARQRLLDASDELFYNEGVHTVGIERVLEKAGVAKGSLYYNFGGKDDLIEAYLTNRHGAWSATIERRLQGVAAPQDQILAVFDALEDLFKRPDYRGCAFMNATAEARPDSVEEQVAERFRAWIHDLFTGLVAPLGVKHPAQLVDDLVVLYDGANTTSQMDKNADAAKTAKRLAHMVLAAA